MNVAPRAVDGQNVQRERIPIVRPMLPPFEEVESGVRRILSSGMVTKGVYLAEFERAVADHLQVRHAVAVSSCTTGLMLTYQALGLTGDVVVPSFTFMATVSSAVWAGLRPRFAEIDPQSCTMTAEAAEQAMTPQTTAIVAVHNFGNPADIDGLRELARRCGVRLVFDAAHGFGTLYNSEPLGRGGDAHVFSLSPTKLLIAGEGGIVATNDDELAEKVRIGREYGNAGNYDTQYAGFNARLAEFNALLGLHSLDLLEVGARRRNEVAALFHRELGALPGLHFQRVRPVDRCSYKDFSVSIDQAVAGVSRDRLAQELDTEGVDTRKYYDPPAHRHTAYHQFADRALPVTDQLAAQSLSLPMWSQMDDSIAFSICRAFRAGWARAATG